MDGTTTTVPEGAAQGILGFIKAKQTDKNATADLKSMDPKAFKDANYWHLKAAPIGGTLLPAEVMAQPIVSLSDPASIAPQLATVLTFFSTTDYSESNPRPNGYTGQLGGKKRHSKTAHKRKHGRTRRAHKGKK
jgi:hypothetical protein